MTPVASTQGPSAARTRSSRPASARNSAQHLLQALAVLTVRDLTRRGDLLTQLGDRIHSLIRPAEQANRAEAEDHDHHDPEQGGAAHTQTALEADQGTSGAEQTRSSRPAIPEEPLPRRAGGAAPSPPVRSRLTKRRSQRAEREAGHQRGHGGVSLSPWVSAAVPSVMQNAMITTGTTEARPATTARRRISPVVPRTPVVDATGRARTTRTTAQSSARRSLRPRESCRAVVGERQPRRGDADDQVSHARRDRPVMWWVASTGSSCTRTSGTT